MPSKPSCFVAQRRTSRRTEKEGADGMMVEGVRPYIMDLGSVNGTFVNNERIEGERYYELLEQVTVDNDKFLPNPQ